MRDERGSIVSVADASGTTMAINSYDEYGIPSSTNLGRFGYTGQAWLPEVGMYYYRARIYSPTLGRFMQTDLIGYSDGMNLYAYVGNDPVNFVDPTGLAGLDDDIVVNGRRFENIICHRMDCAGILGAQNIADVGYIGGGHQQLLSNAAQDQRAIAAALNARINHLQAIADGCPVVPSR